MTEEERIKSINKYGGRHLQRYNKENITYDMCLTAVATDGTALEFVPDEYKEWLKIGICVVVLGLTAIMYRRNNQVDLRKIV